VIAGLLSRATDLLYGEGRASALAMAAHSTRPRVERTQVLRLGTLAERTASVSALLDYVQVQTGKRAEWRQEEFGPRLLRALTDLQGRAEVLAAEATAQGIRNDDLARTLHLELARLFIRHLLAAYVAGPSVQGHPQRPGEGSRLPGPARGAPPDRRQPPGSQAPPQARRPVGDRPPRPEQPAPAAPEITEPASSPVSGEAVATGGVVLSSPDALSGDEGAGPGMREATPAQPSAMEQASPEMAAPQTEHAPAADAPAGSAPAISDDLGSHERAQESDSLMGDVAPDRGGGDEQATISPAPAVSSVEQATAQGPEAATSPPAPFSQGRGAGVTGDDIAPSSAREGSRQGVPDDEATEEHPGGERR